MSRLVLRHFEADGLAAILDIGFIPDKVEVTLDEGTNPDILKWMRRMVDDESVYGHLITGSSGIVTRVTTAATGIEAYDTVQDGVKVESPVPGRGEVFTTVADWTSAVSSAATARSATAVGTIIRPTTHNGYVYECTTAGTSSGTEPTSYPTVPGETVTDNDVVFTTRNEKIAKIGAKGITIGADVSQNTNGNQIYVEAFKADRDPADIDAGSVAAGMPI